VDPAAHSPLLIVIDDRHKDCGNGSMVSLNWRPYRASCVRPQAQPHKKMMLPGD
jgi:hypothetical protein